VTKQEHLKIFNTCIGTHAENLTMFYDHGYKHRPPFTAAEISVISNTQISVRKNYMYRLIYASHARATCLDDIPDILEWSYAHNPGLGITGVLTYMQYLEGEEATVLELFESIRKDTRHRRATILDQRLIARRAYPAWSMALMQWDERTKAIFRSFSPGQHLDLYASDPTTAAPLVRALTRDESWTFQP
jgi:hypothetical protein